MTSVRASSINSNAGSTAVSVARPAGTVEGDVVTIVVNWNDATVTVADNNGATPFTEDLAEFPNNGAAGHGASVFSRRIEAGDPATYNFTLSVAQRWTAVAVTWQNPHPSAIYDVAPSAGNSIAGGVGNPVTVPSIITATANAIHCSILCTDGISNTTSATPAGYTMQQNGGEKLVAFGTKVIAAPSATGGTTYSDTAAVTKTGISFAIRDEGNDPTFAELVDSATPDVVVLAEVQPMEPLAGWTAAGGGLVNTYYCAFLSQIQTAVVAGGLYRRLDSVRQNATALTSRASAALVDANLGSYFLDTATNRLYVSTTTGVSPDTFALLGAWFTLFFSTTTVSLSGQPLYAPMITGSLPTLSGEMPDTLFGATISNSGALSLLNTDGLFDRLSKQYVWRNKLVTFKLGGGSLAYSDFATIETLRINSLTIDDEIAALQLEDVGNILNQSLPLRTWGDGTFVGSPIATLPEMDIFGASQPLVFGTVAGCPLVLGSRVAATSDDWYAYDFNSGPMGSATISSVYAVNRSTQVATLLTFITDYNLPGGAVVRITNPSYFYETHDIIATIANNDTIPATFGTMALSILQVCGESGANIDSAAFAAADLAAPQVLARYVGEPMLAADLMRELEQSVNGQVYKGADGRWTCRILTPDTPASVVDVTDTDFVTWKPENKLRTTLNIVRVRYGHRPLGDQWLEVSSSDDAVLYGAETSDSHRLDTWLTTSGDASALAGHLRFFRGTPATVSEAEQRGLSLITTHVGDFVSVTRARAPVARTGSYDTHLLRIVKIDKALGGETPTVTVGLEDLGGQADRIFRLVPSGSTLTWATATAAERARYGFLGDTNRYLDSTDPLTRDGKALW